MCTLSISQQKTVTVILIDKDLQLDIYELQCLVHHFVQIAAVNVIKETI